MIYQVETFMQDGVTVLRRRPAGVGSDQFQFVGHVTYGVKMPDGQVVREREPLAFAIEAASVEDAFAKLPALYDAASKKFMEDMESQAQKAKEAELRDLLVRP